METLIQNYIEPNLTLIVKSLNNMNEITEESILDLFYNLKHIEESEKYDSSIVFQTSQDFEPGFIQNENKVKKYVFEILSQNEDCFWTAKLLKEIVVNIYKVDKDLVKLEDIQKYFMEYQDSHQGEQDEQIQEIIPRLEPTIETVCFTKTYKFKIISSIQQIETFSITNLSPVTIQISDFINIQVKPVEDKIVKVTPVEVKKVEVKQVEVKQVEVKQVKVKQVEVKQVEVKPVEVRKRVLPDFLLPKKQTSKSKSPVKKESKIEESIEKEGVSGIEGKPRPEIQSPVKSEKQSPVVVEYKKGDCCCYEGCTVKPLKIKICPDGKLYCSKHYAPMLKKLSK